MRTRQAFLRPPRLARVLALLAGMAAAALVPMASHACGACVEDNVAATYDHQTITRAKTAGNVVVFCQISGQFDERQLLNSARRVQGVRAQSLRSSAQPPALSFAFDQTRQSPQAAVDAIARGLPASTRLSIVRVIK